MTTLKHIIEAANENNEINNAKWSDWEDLSHLEEVYGELNDEDFTRDEANEIISKAIETNGQSLKTFDDERQVKLYGEIKFSHD